MVVLVRLTVGTEHCWEDKMTADKDQWDTEPAGRETRGMEEVG